MKIETLCSLATIGVVFAEPILSRQDSPSIQSIEQCMTNELETSVDEMCASTTSAACPHLRELQSCLTHAVYTVSTKTGLTPKEAAGYLTKCTNKAFDFMKSADLNFDQTLDLSRKVMTITGASQKCVELSV